MGGKEQCEDSGRPPHRGQQAKAWTEESAGFSRSPCFVAAVSARKPVCEQNLRPMPFFGSSNQKLFQLF